MADIGNWFNSLPRFTRYWFGGTVALSLLGRFGLVPPHLLILNYDLVINRFQVNILHNALKMIYNQQANDDDGIFFFQIWRPITALLFYPISPQTGFHFLINLYFLVNYSKLLETGIVFS